MKTCSKCRLELDDSAFNKANWIKSGLRSDCKTCYAATKKAYWDKQGLSAPNAARCRLLKLEQLCGVRTCKKCEITLSLSVDSFVKKKSGRWETTCRSCMRLDLERWSERNAERLKALAYERCAKRYADKRNRTPQWLSSEDEERTRAIYAESRNRRLSGENCQVDHIVPLVGDLVSGLHVPWNLRIIGALENQKKSNSFEAA